MSDPTSVSVMLIGRRSSADPLVTPEDIAKRLQTTVRHIHELLRTKQIPGIKLGKLWRVTERDLSAWIESQKKAERVTHRTRPTRSVTVEIRRVKEAM